MTEARMTGSGSSGGPDTAAPKRERRKLGLKYGDGTSSTRPLPSPGGTK